MKRKRGYDAHLTPAKVAEIRRRLVAGDGPAEIAAGVGCTPGAVGYHKRRLKKEAGAPATPDSGRVLAVAARGLARKARRGGAAPAAGDEFYVWVARGYVEGWFNRLEQAITAHRRGRRQ